MASEIMPACPAVVLAPLPSRSAPKLLSTVLPELKRLPLLPEVPELVDRTSLLDLALLVPLMVL